MLHAAFVIALATLAAASPERLQRVTRAAAAPRPCATLYATPYVGIQSKNPANCVVTLNTTATDDKTDGLLTKTTTNWANGNIPTKLRGLFYMEGNPNSVETFSTATAFYNSSSKTWDIPTWAPRTWSQDPYSNSANINLQQGLIFKTACRRNSTSGLLSCDHISYYQDSQTLQHKGDYTLDETSTPDVWIRGSDNQNLIGGLLGAKPDRYYYFMHRVVDENGKRTKLWNSRYIANIGKFQGTTGQSNVHLQATIEVPNRR